MRNLKRALCLALASVMVMGLMVVGTGASYADVSSEENQEAIEVLQEVGVMTGDENGNFNPDALVTRNEMAVVMSNLMDYRVASFAGTAPFTDVPAWAEPYVAACYTNGITSGISATTYGGDQSVTTAQAALMLMKALGYFQYQSDFEDDWQYATIKQAGKIDLFDKVDTAVTEAMTRNDLAQLVLNTLASGTVEANKSGQDIAIEGVTITNNVTYSYVTSQKDYAKAISSLRGVSATSISTQGYIVELGEKLYNGDLKRTEDVTDAFGRPATKWAYKTNEIGTYGDTPIATYTAKVTKGTLWSLIGKSNVDALSAAGDRVTVDGNSYYINELKVYADGREIADGDVDKTDYFSNNSSAAIGGATVGATPTSYNGKAGKGVLTEVYQDNDNNVTIVFVNTYVLQANGDYNENKGTLAVSSVTYPGSVNTLYDEDFDLAGIADEDYVLVTASTSNGTSYTVESVAKADVITGNVEAYSETNNVTIDGTKYDYAEKIDSTAKATTYTVGTDAAVVLDEYGYVVYVDDAALSIGQYLYVNAVITSTGFSKSYVADAYFTDGTNDTIDIDALYTWNSSASKHEKQTTLTGVTASIADTTDDFNGWYSFSVNSDDEYTLKAVKAVTASGQSSKGITYSAGQKVIEGEKTSFLYRTSNNTLKNSDVYGTDKTIFIVDDGDDITVYTGIKNAPDIKVKTDAGSVVKVSYLYDKDTTGKPAAAVFVDASEGLVDDQSSEEFLYVLNRDTTYVNKANGDTIYTWNVILNGEVTQIDAKANSALEPYTLFDKVKVDGDGYYDATKFEDSSKIGNTYYHTGITSGTAEFTYSDNVLSLGTAGTFIVTDDTKITLVLKDCTTSSANLGGTAASDPGMEQIMTDPDAKHEVVINTNGKYIDRLLKDRDVVTANVYSVIDEAGSQILETLYIEVSSVESL